MRRSTSVFSLTLVILLASQTQSSDVNGPATDADRASSPTVRQKGVTISLRHAEPVSTPCGNPAVDVVYHNGTSDPVIVIEPQGGSIYGWLPPHYAWQIVNTATDEKVKLPGSCGLYGGTFNHKTMHVVLPGDSKSLKVTINVGRKVGEYRVQLTYRVARDAYLANAGLRWNVDRRSAVALGQTACSY
jgi:hypothetical protein